MSTTPATHDDRRRIAFEGAVNFRDLGGYPTEGGGTTRWGRVYRSDALHNLTDADVERYGELGIKVVYDLRRDTEREKRPHKVNSRATCIMSIVNAAGNRPFDGRTFVDQRGGERMLRDMFVALVDHAGPVIGTVLTGLADPQHVPAVFNCHAGKDRTGLMAATLLSALGVPREVVLDDFELTGLYCGQLMGDGTFDTLVALGLVPEAAAGALGAPRWAMAEALDHLDEQFGGIERYLAEQAGVDAGTLAALRAQLVE